MAINALVKITDFELPEPSSYKGQTSTIVDSGRNLDGVLIGSVIRDDVAKVELSWRYLTIVQWSDINKLFNPSAGGKFINEVTFFNQSMGIYDTRQMYVSDRNAGLWRRDPVTGEVLGWLDCKLNLIEV